MATTLTINDLAKYVEFQKKQGNGNKKILISNDDEGNGYHSLFYQFSNAKEMFEGEYPPMLPYGVNKEDLNDYIILG